MAEVYTLKLLRDYPRSVQQNDRLDVPASILKVLHVATSSRPLVTLVWPKCEQHCVNTVALLLRLLHLLDELLCSHPGLLRGAHFLQ